MSKALVITGFVLNVTGASTLAGILAKGSGYEAVFVVTFTLAIVTAYNLLLERTHKPGSPSRCAASASAVVFLTEHGVQADTL